MLFTASLPASELPAAVNLMALNHPLGAGLPTAPFLDPSLNNTQQDSAKVTIPTALFPVIAILHPSTDAFKDGGAACVGRCTSHAACGTVSGFGD